MDGVKGAWANRFIKLFLFFFKKYAWVTGKDSWSFVRFNFILSTFFFSLYMGYYIFFGSFFMGAISIFVALAWSISGIFVIKIDHFYFDQLKKIAEPDRIYSMADIFFYRLVYKHRYFSLTVNAFILVYDTVFTLMFLLGGDYFAAMIKFTSTIAIFNITMIYAGSMVYLQSPYKSLYSRAKAKAKEIKNNIKIPSLLPPPLPTPVRVRI